MSDRAVRSLAKAVSWRITGTGATFAISYAVSGSFSIAGTIATIQLVANTILYYIHERVWDRVNWGRL